MSKQDVMRILAESRDAIHEMGIASLRLFGSVVRDEAGSDSDIDLLVEFSNTVGLFEFARVRRRLSELLGHPVDLVTRNALHDEMRERILAEAVDAA